MKRLLLILLLVCSNAWAVNFTDIKFGNKQMGDSSSWNVYNCVYTNSCTAGNISSVGSMRRGNGTSFTLGATQYLKFSYTNTDPAEPWTITAYNADGTVAAVLGTYRIMIAGQGYFMTSNQPHPNAGNGTLWSTQVGMTSMAPAVTFSGTSQPTPAQMNTLANSYYSPDPITVSGQTYSVPLCCGGSNASFNADPTKVNKINTFATRATSDSQVYIEQIGNSNTITVNQSGTKNNNAVIDATGSFNTTTITQSGNTSTQTNYAEVTIHGDSNNTSITQTSTGGGKGAFVNVTDNNNNVTVMQKDGGSDYLSIDISGGNKTVSVTQQGAGNHMADITLSGAGSRSLNLTQSGSTQQSYSINSSCASSCQAITVTQGQ